jgi:hypothetical protein
VSRRSQRRREAGKAGAERREGAAGQHAGGASQGEGAGRREGAAGQRAGGAGRGEDAAGQRGGAAARGEGDAGWAPYATSGWGLGVQLAFLAAVFAVVVLVAELAGAANLGVALGIGQIAFAIAVVYVLLRR